ncbi:MAG: DMT family transporter [Chloroflexota bacterium]|nr:DMT family transporter [Chloroflexota bacterium]
MPLRVIAGYALLTLLWGSTWAAIKVGVAAVPPWTFALDRAGAVALLLTLVSLVLRLRFPRGRRVLAAAALAGVFNVGSAWAIIFWAEQYVPSGVVAVFGASTPVWTAILAHFLVRGDRFTTLKVVALAAGLAGTVALIGAAGAGTGPEALLATVLLALMSVSWGVAAILAARVLKHESPLPVIAVETWVGALFLLPLAVTELGRPARWGAESLIAFGYLVVFGSAVGLVLNLWLYRVLRPTTVSLTQVVIPAVALLIGTVALAEPITSRMLIGAALIALAVGANARAGSTDLDEDRSAPATAPSPAE